MEIAILPGQSFAGGELLLRFLQDLPQPREIFFRGAGAGEFRRLDLVDLPEFHRFVDLHRVERQAGAREQRHRLHARLPGVDIDTGLGAPLHDAHGFEDGERLADLAAADGKMLGQFALGGRAAALAVGMGEEIGGEFRQKRVFFHRQQRCACASRNFSETVNPSPGFSGIATIPSRASTVSLTRS